MKMRIPEHKDKDYLEAIDTYLPLGARILEEMISEQGKLVTTFRELIVGHNNSLENLAEVLRRSIEATEVKRKAEEESRQAQKDLDYVRSPEYITSLELELLSELNAISDPEERRRFLVRKVTSLEGKIAESKAQKPEDDNILIEMENSLANAKDSQLKAAKGKEMTENELYKRALELGETEEEAFRIATMDHLPGMFEIYDFLTIIYGISTEKEVVQRKAKIRYLLEV